MCSQLIHAETTQPDLFEGDPLRISFPGMVKRKVLMPLDEDCCGLVLAEDIWNQTHTQVMVGQGAQLTGALIEKLDNMGIYEVPVEVEEELSLPGRVDLSSGDGDETRSAATTGEAPASVGLHGTEDSAGNTRRTLWERDQLVHDGSVVVLSQSAARSDTIARGLTPLNVEVLAAANEQEALGILGQRLPFILILDLPLAGHEEWGVLRVLEETQTQHVAVIVISGNNDREMILQARRHGVKSYLMWPFDPALLRERVERFRGAPAI